MHALIKLRRIYSSGVAKNGGSNPTIGSQSWLYWTT